MSAQTTETVAGCAEEQTDIGVDFVLAQEAWSNQEEKYAQAYQDAHRGARLDSNHRRDLARSFGFERIRGAPLFDDPRSKESEI